jgi:hypothetical protein
LLGSKSLSGGIFIHPVLASFLFHVSNRHTSAYLI